MRGDNYMITRAEIVRATSLVLAMNILGPSDIPKMEPLEPEDPEEKEEEE